ncbi:MAG: Crp/Fnr family transcriptional regulator [Jatrophihabitantaceae bacterium]
MLSSARRRQFARGEIVFHEGDHGDSLHLVESGLLAVHVSTPGGERVTLNVLTPGGFFGEMALLQSAQVPRRSATVRALVPAQTLAVSGPAFAQLLQSHPLVERLVVAALAQRVQELSGRLLEAIYLGVDRRVYARLLELSEACRGASSEVVIPLSQDELANMVGASRPTVNQVLQKLVSRQTISLHRRQIVIEDLPALRKAAPEPG